jgi:plastocyanin
VKTLRFHRSDIALVTVRATCCVGLLAALTGCAPRPDGPQVATTAQVKADHVVEVGKGAINPPCLVVDVGQTVEFRNSAPDVPTDLTSLGSPVELYSPSLQRGGPMGSEAGKEFAWWRHTFARPGVFEYYDTHRGEPGQKVVDPYYGTVTWVGVNPNLETGIVCVQEPGSGQCLGICCVKNNDGSAVLSQGECTQSQCCDAKSKRCLAISPASLVCQAGLGEVSTTAARTLQCFRDQDCPAQGGKPQRCVTNNQNNHVCQP